MQSLLQSMHFCLAPTVTVPPTTWAPANSHSDGRSQRRFIVPRQGPVTLLAEREKTATSTRIWLLMRGAGRAVLGCIEPRIELSRGRRGGGGGDCPRLPVRRMYIRFLFLIFFFDVLCSSAMEHTMHCGVAVPVTSMAGSRFALASLGGMLVDCSIAFTCTECKGDFLGSLRT